MKNVPSIDSIFCTAVEIVSPDARRSYLDVVCVEKPELRRQLDRLLSAHDRGGSLVDSPTLLLVDTNIQSLFDGIGTHVGPFELLQQIGEGGMGVVYMAQQTQPMQRKVALKLIKAGMDSRQVIARFEAERQALAMMDHVNIARVLDAGTTSTGMPYFVMELVHGVPITKYCDDNRLTTRQRLELFIPVCHAIQHAHQKGIVHRDIKPSNVMIALCEGQPVPKVIDFGVAKAIEQKRTERTMSTQCGTLVGTLEYMSPEQAEMNPQGIDTRSDIYSLGALLYELLTGTTPLSSRRMKYTAYSEVLRLIKEEDPPKPSSRLSELGDALASISELRQTDPNKLSKLLQGELDWILMKPLEKDRNRRYATANDFAADVQRYLDDAPVQACPPSVGYRFRKFVRRNKGAVLAGTGLLSLLLFTLGFALYSNTQINDALSERTTAYKKLEIEQKKTAEALNAAREAERHTTEKAIDLTESLYFESIARADLEYSANNLPYADRALDRCPESLRNWEWKYLKRICHTELRALQGHDQLVTSLSFHPNARWLATGAVDGRVLIWDFVTGKVIRRLPVTTNAVTSIAFSPDGVYLARAAGRWQASVPGDVQVFEAATGAEVATFKQSKAHIDEIAWSPDSRQLAGASWGGTVKICDLMTRTQRELATDNSLGAFTGVAWSQDGRLIAGCGNHANIHVWDAASGNALGVYSGHAGAVVALEFSPDLKTLLSAGTDQSIKVWNVEEGKLQRTLTGHTSSIGELAYSPDGARFVSTCNDGTVKVWDAIRFVEIETIHSHIREARGVTFHPGGALIATGGWDGSVKLWDLHAPQRHQSLSFPNASGRQVSISPDGQMLAVASCLPATRDQPGSLRLYNLTTMEEVCSLSEHRGGHLTAAFHPDGQLLAADEDELVVLWDVTTGERQRTLEGHDKAVCHVAFSPDRRYLATASEDQTIRLWNTDTYQTFAVLKGHDEAVKCVAFSNDSQTLVSTGQDGKVLLWEIGADVSVPLRSFAGHEGPINALAWRPFLQQFATGGDDETIRIWDADTGRELHCLSTHVADVRALDYSPDGSRLASGGVDGLVVLWDAAQGREAHSFRREMNDVSALASLPDGRRLFAANHKAMTSGGRIWNAGEISPHDSEERLLELSLVKTSSQLLGLASQAQSLFRAGQWQDAIEKYGLVINERPDNFSDFANRAFALGAIGNLQEARIDYMHALHLLSARPSSPEYGAAAFFYCNILVELGDIEAYHEEINYVRRRLGVRLSSDALYTISSFYRLGPHPSVELKELLEHAKALLKENPEDLLAALALANLNYADGRYQESLNNLDIVTALRGGSTHNQIVETLYYAINYSRLGNRDQAREYLTNAQVWLDEHLHSGKTPPGLGFAPHWSYHLDLERLRKEAELLVE